MVVLVAVDQSLLAKPRQEAEDLQLADLELPHAPDVLPHDDCNEQQRCLRESHELSRRTERTQTT